MSCNKGFVIAVILSFAGAVSLPAMAQDPGGTGRGGCDGDCPTSAQPRVVDYDRTIYFGNGNAYSVSRYGERDFKKVMNKWERLKNKGFPGGEATCRGDVMTDVNRFRKEALDDGRPGDVVMWDTFAGYFNHPGVEVG